MTSGRRKRLLVAGMLLMKRVLDCHCAGISVWFTNSQLFLKAKGLNRTKHGDKLLYKFIVIMDRKVSQAIIMMIIV